MRPTPDELAIGIRGLLRTFAPEITSPQGVRNFRRAMATLRDARWSEAGFDVLAENVVLGHSLEAIRDAPTATASIVDLRSEIEALLAERVAPVSFAAANERNSKLRLLLCSCLDALGAHDLGGSSALRREITERLLSLRAPATGNA